MTKTLGIVLIVLGLFGLAWGGFTYTTTEKGRRYRADSRYARKGTSRTVASDCRRGGAYWRRCTPGGRGKRITSVAPCESKERKNGNAATHHNFGVGFWPRWRLLRT